MAGPAGGDDGGRGHFNSRAGYIFAMVGSAVGLGNIVRFPFATSQGGGGAFVMVYIAFVALFGIPMVLAEMTLGRRSQKNVVDTFIELASSKWAVVGLFFIFLNIIVMGWYSVIGGWTLRYIVDGLTGIAWGAGTAGGPEAYFLGISEGPLALLFHAVFMSIVIAIVAGGVSDGIEPVVTTLMPILIVLLVGLAIYGMTLPGAGDGLAFYLSPDFSSITGNTIVTAVGQAFFSMSIGFGALITYASYMDRDSSLTDDGVIVGSSDTLVALTAGFLVFPLLAVVFDPSQLGGGGVGVVFQAVPVVFESIGELLGQGVGIAFFFLVFAAALSSAISLMEVGVGYMTDQGLSRIKSTLVIGLVMYSLGIAMAFSGPILDFVAGPVTGILVTLGALLIAIFLGWIYPRTLDEDPVEEMQCNPDDFRIGRPAVAMIRYPIPVVLGLLLIVAVANAFGVTIL